VSSAAIGRRSQESFAARVLQLRLYKANPIGTNLFAPNSQLSFMDFTKSRPCCL
jgi:hypothetical protein